MYMYFNDGFTSWHVYTFAEAYFTIEYPNIATWWACLDIPSQWFTSQSVIVQCMISNIDFKAYDRILTEPHEQLKSYHICTK